MWVWWCGCDGCRNQRASDARMLCVRRACSSRLTVRNGTGVERAGRLRLDASEDCPHSSSGSQSSGGSRRGGLVGEIPGRTVPSMDFPYPHSPVHLSVEQSAGVDVLLCFSRVPSQPSTGQGPRSVVPYQSADIVPGFRVATRYSRSAGHFSNGIYRARLDACESMWRCGREVTGRSATLASQAVLAPVVCACRKGASLEGRVRDG